MAFTKKPKGFIWTNEVTKKEFNRLINNVLPLEKKLGSL